jgi:hypothetical protein
MAMVRIKHPQVGETEMSDRSLPHLKERGWELVGPVDEAVPASATDLVKAPHRNASTEDWQAYAKHRGMTPELAADMGRDELVAFYLTDTQES